MTQASTWVSASLGDLLPLSYGKALSEKLRDASGSHFVFGSAGIAGKHSIALTAGPTLIVGRKGNAGAVHFSTEPCWVIDTAYFTQPNERLDLKFGYYLLKSLNLRKLDRSTAVPSLGRDDYSAVSVSIPEARVEQERIVAKIEELFSDLDAGVAGLERTLAKLKRYRASVLKAAVAGRLTAAWRAEQKANGVAIEPAAKLLERILAERRRKWEATQLQKFSESKKQPPKAWQSKYREPTKPITTNLSDLPSTWQWASVEQLSTKVTDGVHKKPNYVPVGVPFVTVRNLTAGPGISFEKLNHITEDDHAEFIKRTDPEFGDILISKDGTLGVIRLIETNTVFSIFVSVALIKPAHRLGSKYLAIALESPAVQAQMVPKGSGLQHIHLEDLRQDCIPIPPEEEQSEIIQLVESALTSITHAETEITHALARAARLRQAILKRAFEGRLV